MRACGHSFQSIVCGGSAFRIVAILMRVLAARDRQMMFLMMRTQSHHAEKSKAANFGELGFVRLDIQRGTLIIDLVCG